MNRHETPCAQDRIAENRTYVFLNTKASCYSHVAEIRSVQEARFGVPKTLTLKLTSKANNFGRAIRLCMHHIKQASCRGATQHGDESP